METRRVTINDVAHLAGVSATTVSHVMNKTRYVSKETKQKVLNAMQELDYYSSIQAKALATGRTNTLGLIVSDISNPFFPQVIQGIEYLASNDGYDILLFNTNYDIELMNKAARKLIEFRADGSFIMTTEVNPDVITLLNSKKISVVALDWGITGKRTVDIKENFYNGINEAIDYLINLEHRNIALLTGPMEFRTANIRKNCFIASIERYSSDLVNFSIFEGDFKIEGGRKLYHEIMKQEPMPTAIIASNDLMAIGLMQEAKQEGKKIPEELSIIGIDDISFASLIDPPLTTICIPREKIYKAAWESMFSLLNGSSNGDNEKIIDTFLIRRGSVAKPEVKS